MEPIVVPAATIRKELEGNLDLYRDGLAPFLDLGDRYRSDSALRARIDAGDVEDLVADLGIDVPSGVKARIVAQTGDTYYFVLPPDPNVALSDETLASVAGGGKSASTVSTVATAGTFGCSSAPSSISSAGSAACGATAGGDD